MVTCGTCGYQSGDYKEFAAHSCSAEMRSLRLQIQEHEKSAKAYLAVHLELESALRQISELRDELAYQKKHTADVVAFHQNAEQRAGEHMTTLERQVGEYAEIVGAAKAARAKRLEKDPAFWGLIDDLIAKEILENSTEKRDGPCDYCSLTHGQHRPACRHKRVCTSDMKCPVSGHYHPQDPDLDEQT